MHLYAYAAKGSSLRQCFFLSWQVACYKICTVRLNLPQGASSDADTDEADVAAVSLPPSERGSAKVSAWASCTRSVDAGSSSQV